MRGALIFCAAALAAGAVYGRPGHDGLLSTRPMATATSLHLQRGLKRPFLDLNAIPVEDDDDGGFATTSETGSNFSGHHSVIENGPTPTSAHAPPLPQIPERDEALPAQEDHHHLDSDPSLQAARIYGIFGPAPSDLVEPDLGSTRRTAGRLGIRSRRRYYVDSVRSFAVMIAAHFRETGHVSVSSVDIRHHILTAQTRNLRKSRQILTTALTKLKHGKPQTEVLSIPDPLLPARLYMDVLGAYNEARHQERCQTILTAGVLPSAVQCRKEQEKEAFRGPFISWHDFLAQRNDAYNGMETAQFRYKYGKDDAITLVKANDKLGLLKALSHVIATLKGMDAAQISVSLDRFKTR